jgi:2-oxoglutarate dehydrogenase E2 component (dihydrolipoamide succinyltransferase)
MSISVELPALGESVLEGTVARWLVKEGDRVEVDQPIVEVTTDKVDAEIPAPTAGVIEAIVAAEGDVVLVGGVLARIAEGASAGAPAAKPAAPAKPAAAAAPAAAPKPAPAPAPKPVAPVAAPASEAPRATPTARRAAEDRGVDLRAVEPTGIGGRVTRADVERGPSAPAPVAAGRPAAPASAPAAARAPERPAFRADFGHYAIQEGDKVIPMSPLRKLVAEHMVYSKLTSPHVGTVAEVDLGGVTAVRARAKDRFAESHGFPLTFLPFVVAVTVRALREHPGLNASVVGDAIVEKKDVSVGIAVETEKGLVVPVVRHADRLSLAGLAAAIEDLSGRARNKRLTADDLKGGTFTVSNPGRAGNLYGFAIINQPQVGILRMGEIVKRPVVRTTPDGSDAIVIRPMMYLALSYDHRAVDGAPANAFLHRVRELLEEADFDV